MGRHLFDRSFNTVLDKFVSSNLRMVSSTSKKGLLNNLLLDLEIISEPIKFVHNTSGTLIGMAHIMLPFLILPLYANMRSIDRDCVRAAASLGATPSRAFWTVFSLFQYQVC